MSSSFNSFFSGVSEQEIKAITVLRGLLSTHFVSLFKVTFLIRLKTLVKFYFQHKNKIMCVCLFRNVFG